MPAPTCTRARVQIHGSLFVWLSSSESRGREPARLSPSLLKKPCDDLDVFVRSLSLCLGTSLCIHIELYGLRHHADGNSATWCVDTGGSCVSFLACLLIRRRKEGCPVIRVSGTKESNAFTVFAVSRADQKEICFSSIARRWFHLASFAVTAQTF